MKAKDKPLEVKRVGDVLTITIGIETLRFAMQQKEIDDVEGFNEVQESIGVTKKRKPCKIISAKGFADDFADMCLKEEEDGSTEISRFFDSIGNDVMEYGSEHVDYPDDE